MGAKRMTGFDEWALAFAIGAALVAVALYVSRVRARRQYNAARKEVWDRFRAELHSEPNKGDMAQMEETA